MKKWVVFIVGIVMLMPMLMKFVGFYKRFEPPKWFADGYYDSKNDRIWIDESLEGEEREAVISHEQYHQKFYRAIPFYNDIYIFILALGGLLLIFCFRRRWQIILLVFLILIISKVTELHANFMVLLDYGITFAGGHSFLDLIGEVFMTIFTCVLLFFGLAKKQNV